MMNTDELLDAEQVLINPLNRSTSKQQYSFPKANRFGSSKTEHSEDHFYDIPSTKSRIASSMGREQRSTFDNKNSFLPGPNNYSYRMDGEFGSGGLQKQNKRGCYFALGRDDIKINSFLTISNDSPNPGRYNPESNKSLTKQYSFSREIRNKDKSRSLFPNVGPGSYRIISSLDQHKQFLSNQRKSAAPKMAQVKVDNRKDTTTKHPPLYKPKTNTRGDLVGLGNLKRGCAIGNSKRMNIVTIGNMPGPGQYKIFSEFLGRGK